jgi:hypothetical protein
MGSRAERKKTRRIWLAMVTLIRKRREGAGKEEGGNGQDRTKVMLISGVNGLIFIA